MADHLHVVLPPGHRLAGRKQVQLADLEGEPLMLPRRNTPAGRFRTTVEHLCAHVGFKPRVAYDLDDLPAAQAFAAAGIAVVVMHALTLGTVPPGAVAVPLADRPAGSRTIEALAPEAGRSALADELLKRLHTQARAYARAPRPGADDLLAGPPVSPPRPRRTILRADVRWAA